MSQNTLVTASLTFNLTDSLTGKPAAGVRYQLYWTEERGDVLLRAGTTNSQGSTDNALLDSVKLSAGVHKLVLHMGDYYESSGISDARQFMDLLPIVFIVFDASRHTHIQIETSTDSYQVRRTT